MSHAYKQRIVLATATKAAMRKQAAVNQQQATAGAVSVAVVQNSLHAQTDRKLTRPDKNEWRSMVQNTDAVRATSFANAAF